MQPVEKNRLHPQMMHHADAVVDPCWHHAQRYDNWFEENRLCYEAELRAVRSLLPTAGESGLEIGVGTGRFAAPLGIRTGLEPSKDMARLAQQRGVDVVQGVAEELPFKDSAVQLILMATVDCFVLDLRKVFKEAFRALSDRGSMVVALLDCGSPLGQLFDERKAESLFFRNAVFRSVDELVAMMEKSGFSSFRFCQTVFQDPSGTTGEEPVLDGHGKGLFAVVHGTK